MQQGIQQNIGILAAYFILNGGDEAILHTLL